MPLTASVESFLTMVNESPVAGLNPNEMTSKAPLVKVTVPVTSTWSYWVPTVAPFSSTLKVPPDATLKSPVLSTPGLLPGAIVPLFAMLTVPLTVPLPPRTPFVPTLTAEPLAVEPFTSSFPSVTVVAPV